MSSPGKSLQLFAETLELHYGDEGQGRAYLLLHGGAGPQSIGALGAALQNTARVLTPIHPGFSGTARPEWFSRVKDLALAYLTLLERLNLRDVVVVGNSVGGWIAAEMGLRSSPRLAAIVLLNAVGIDTGSPDKHIIDPLKVPPSELASLAFHDPGRYAITPTTPEARAVMVANQQTLRTYAGEPFMHDPALYARLAAMSVPSLVIWGQSDGIVDMDYGRRFAGGMPRSTFEVVTEAGHFPHIEQPTAVLKLLENFTRELQ